VTAFPVADLRREFPALAQAGDFLFFDNAAGAQVPANVLAAVTDHLVSRNVQRGGPYGRSQEVDAMIARAREAVAAFVNARASNEIAFGLNATSFIRSISLAVGQTLGARPEIVVTDLDHEANIATWVALERFGARIVWWKIRDDGRLYVEDLERLGCRTGADSGAPRRAVIRTAMEAIAAYERTLSAALLDAVRSIDGAVVHGVTDRGQLADRVPTVSFTVEGVASSAIAAQLAAGGVGARSGHMYAPRLMRRLKLMPEGTVRVSLVHYNTLDEIARFRERLAEGVAALKPTPRQDAGVPTAGR